MNFNHKEYLKEKGISPLYTRVKIFEYLEMKKSHPTADEIYKALVGELPTLSKTTVYNVLKLLIEKDIVKSVNIGDNEMKYEFVTKEHSHFKCCDCGKLFDIPLVSTTYDSKDLNGFRIDESQVLFKGICPSCQIKGVN
ncbi:MAG: transcriptional repressor [Candidatus Izemoplasma sp.]